MKLSHKNKNSDKAGFTLLELLVVSIIMVGTITLTAQFWRSFLLSMNDLAWRANTAREMRMLIENLMRDFGSAVGVTIMDESTLLICTEGGDRPNGQADWGPPDVTIEYYITGTQLRRYDESIGNVITVAENVSSFNLEKVSETQIKILAQLTSGTISRQAEFLWTQP
jgi:prepilin-type N-terminal cleavage/methylation domain-containing protein